MYGVLDQTLLLTVIPTKFVMFPVMTVKSDQKVYVLQLVSLLGTNQSSRQQGLIQVNQGSNMTNILDHTLVNPNLCRLFDISWCEDFWDPHRELGMTILDSLLEIPFDTVGSTLIFISQTPMEQEYKNQFNTRVVLTNEMTKIQVNLCHH